MSEVNALGVQSRLLQYVAFDCIAPMLVGLASFAITNDPRSENVIAAILISATSFIVKLAFVARRASAYGCDYISRCGLVLLLVHGSLLIVCTWFVLISVAPSSVGLLLSIVLGSVLTMSWSWSIFAYDRAVDGSSMTGKLVRNSLVLLDFLRNSMILLFIQGFFRRLTQPPDLDISRDFLAKVVYLSVVPGVLL